eukprot:977908-Pleurochrysis_carterae.AAC.4
MHIYLHAEGHLCVGGCVECAQNPCLPNGADYVNKVSLRPGFLSNARESKVSISPTKYTPGENAAATKSWTTVW